MRSGAGRGRAQGACPSHGVLTGLKDVCQPGSNLPQPGPLGQALLYPIIRGSGGEKGGTGPPRPGGPLPKAQAASGSVTQARSPVGLGSCTALGGPPEPTPLLCSRREARVTPQGTLSPPFLLVPPGLSCCSAPALPPQGRSVLPTLGTGPPPPLEPGLPGSPLPQAPAFPAWHLPGLLAGSGQSPIEGGRPGPGTQRAPTGPARRALSVARDRK